MSVRLAKQVVTKTVFATTLSVTLNVDAELLIAAMVDNASMTLIVTAVIVTLSAWRTPAIRNRVDAMMATKETVYDVLLLIMVIIQAVIRVIYNI